MFFLLSFSVKISKKIVILHIKIILMETSLRNQIIALIKREVVPALGCTEPIAVALAVAKSREILGKQPERTVIHASPNIFKNGMGVGIPGTGMVGLHIAAALGVVAGKSSEGLEVLKHISPDDVDKAKELVMNGSIELKLKETDEKLYIEAHCLSGNDEAVSVIRGSHNHFSLILKNKEIIEESQVHATSETSATDSFVLDMPTIYEFATTAPLDELSFIMEGAEMNKRLSEFGLANRSGLGVGASMLNAIHKKILNNDVQHLAALETAAASDARMSGAMFPAMSNSGSGNQGITAMVPVLTYGKYYQADEEQLIRALIISNLTVIHIKKHFGRLSAACGCVVASTGAACGITYLMGGNLQQINAAIKNMIANLAGMLCDGAKLGCALKVSTGTYAAVQSAILAMQNISASENDGIIDQEVEQTISNLGRIASEGMNETDKLLLHIMSSKHN